MTRIFKFAALTVMCGAVVYCGGGSSGPKKEEESKYTEYIGLSMLSARHSSFKCGWITDALEGIKRPALAVLWPSFGTKNECIEEYVQDEREKVLNVYLHNGTCKAKGNCSSLDSVDLREQILGGAAQVNELYQISTNTKLILTVGLEDVLSDMEACAFKEVLSNLLPGVEVWRNPRNNNSSDFCFDGIELHNIAGANLHPQGSWSNDGYDTPVGGFWRLQFRYSRESLLAKVLGRRGNTQLYYIWDSTGNGLVNDSASAPYPHLRTIDFTDSDIKEYNSILLEIQNEFTK